MQHLTCQVGAGVRWPAGSYRVSARRRIPGDVALQQIKIADDDGEQIVEIVSDAAGEIADRLHLLGLPKPLLDRLVIRDVLHHAEDVLHFAVLAANGLSSRRHQARAVLRHADRVVRAGRFRIPTAATCGRFRR